MTYQTVQPMLEGVDWGARYDLEREFSGHGDAFINFDTFQKRVATFPIKYSFEAMINNSLGIISCLGGKISSTDYLDKVNELFDSRSNLSEEGVSRNEATIWLARKPPRDRYERCYPTYQGDFLTAYTIGESHFTLEHTQYDLSQKLYLDFAGIGNFVEVLGIQLLCKDTIPRAVFGVPHSCLYVV